MLTQTRKRRSNVRQIRNQRQLFLESLEDRHLLAAFNVTSPLDAVDRNVGDGICEDTSGNCSLRAAVQEASALPGSDAINLPAGHYRFELDGMGEDASATGDLDVLDALSITGAGAGDTIVDAVGKDRVFHVLAAGELNLAGLTLTGGTATGGAATNGGAIFNAGGRVEVVRSSLVDNLASSGGAIYNFGGGIVSVAASEISRNTVNGQAGALYNSGFSHGTSRLTLVDSTVADNSAGGIGGGIVNSGILQIENSTLSGNHSNTKGGALYNNFANSVDIVSSTIADNSAADAAGGISNFDGIIRVSGSIIANNRAALNPDVNSDGNGSPAAFTSLGHNLVGNVGSALGFTDGAQGDLVGSLTSPLDPLLAPLSGSDGKTATHALLPDSPAIDAGSAATAPVTDQRGVSRPQDGNHDGIAEADIGAFEFESAIQLINVNLWGGGGDQFGTDISIEAGGLFVSGTDRNIPGGQSLAYGFDLPAGRGLDPSLRWDTGWPPGTDALGSENFNAVTAVDAGVYYVGVSYQQTSDGVGAKEPKGINVTFGEDGPHGDAVGGAESVSAPQFFAHRGYESLTDVVIFDDGTGPAQFVIGAGEEAGFGGTRSVMAKLTLEGDVVWKRKYGTDSLGASVAGTSTRITSNARAIVELDGFMYVAGDDRDATAIDGEAAQGMLLKFDPAAQSPDADPDGFTSEVLEPTWARQTGFNAVFSGITAFDDSIFAVGNTFTSGVAGGEDFLIQKYDSEGSLVWSVADGGATTDILIDALAWNGSLYVTGYTDGPTGRDVVMMEIDPMTGGIIDRSIFAGPEDDQGNGLATDGRSLFVIGTSRSFTEGGNLPGESDLLLLQYDVGSPPEANDDNFVVTRDSSRNVLDVLRNDADFAATSPILAVGPTGQGGIVSIADDNISLRYTPPAGFQGIETFTYTLQNDRGGVDQALVSVHVNPREDVEVLMDLEITDLAGAPVSSVAVGQQFVLQALVQDVRLDPTGAFAAFTDVFYSTNLVDPVGSLNFGPAYPNVQSGDPSTPGLLDEVGGVSLFAEVGGRPRPLFSQVFTATNIGTASFSSDGADDLPAHHVSVYDQDTPVPPRHIEYGQTVLQILPRVVAADDAFTVEEDSSDTLLAVLNNDLPDDGELTIASVGPASQGGTVSVTADGHSLVYTPSSDFYGVETVVYTARHSGGGLDTATVTLTITNVNDPPTAIDDVFLDVLEDGGIVELDVLANDDTATDFDEALTISAVGETSRGGLVTIVDGGAHLDYQPAANFFGTETFAYTISDGNGGAASATVTVVVENANDAPTAVADPFDVQRGSRDNVLDVLANDSILPDVNETLRVSAVGTPSGGGIVSIGPGGQHLLYSPAIDGPSEDRFTYAIVDNNGSTSQSTVVINLSNGWTNPTNILDVNGDGFVTPIDALVVINDLNANGARALPDPATVGQDPWHFFDVNGDGYTSPLDVLKILNFLNDGREGEGEASGSRVPTASRSDWNTSIFEDPTEDVRLSGATSHDHNDVALLAIQAEWTNPDQGDHTRVANIDVNDSNPDFADRLNGDFFLKKGADDPTVFYDNVVDLFFDGFGRDWRNERFN